MIGGKKVALHPRCHQRVEARVLGRKWVSRPKKAYRGLVDDAYCGFRPELGAIGRKKFQPVGASPLLGRLRAPGPGLPGAGGRPAYVSVWHIHAIQGTLSSYGALDDQNKKIGEVKKSG